jgi:hypothetical protein
VLTWGSRYPAFKFETSIRHAPILKLERSMERLENNTGPKAGERTPDGAY